MNNFYTKNLVLFLVALMLTLSVQASYLRNVPQKLVQPDGKIVNCYATGDEFYHWVHDEAGFTIVKNIQTGYLCYAVLSGDDLVASPYIVGEVSPSSVGLTPWINIPSRKMGEMREQFLDLERTYSIKKTGKYDGPVNVQSKGEINNIVVYIRFAGESEYTVTQPSIGNQFNGSTPGVLSMHNYYDEVSYGTLNMATHFLPSNNGTQIISYQDSHTRDYFQEFDATTNPTGYTGGGSGAERTDREHTLLQSAINSIKGQLDPGVNIDNDGDGLVDNVCFIAQGAPGAWSSLLWPHKWQMHTKDAFINGKQVWVYNFQLQSVLSPSVLCHEMFHSLGAPDLYHYTDGTPDPIGPWDLMNQDNGQHMTQYMKYRYGKWIENIPEITASGDYTLNPVFTKDNSCFKVKSPFSQSEYFVIEYRKKEKLDAALPNEGLLIYRINTVADGVGNRNGPPDEVYIYRPGGSITAEGSLNLAPFSSNLGKTSFSDKTNPDAYLSNGGIGGLNLSNISAIGATMSFHIEIFNPLNVDVAVTKLLTPVSSSALTSTEKVKVIITNLGLTAIASGIKVNYRVNGGSVVSQDFPLSIAAGTSLPYEFAAPVDFSNPGVYNIEVYTTLTGDQNIENDKVVATIINPIPLEYLAANSSSTIGTYTGITTGAPIAVDQAKNGFSAPTSFPDGFTFKFSGTSFSKFILSTNGFIKLGDQNPSSKSLYFTEPQTAEGGIFNSLEGADNNIIAPFSHDLVPGDGGAEYRMNISGTAPGRIVTIQFKNVRDNDAKMANQYSSMNFQIKLYEGSNIIEFVYGLWTPSANTSNFKTSLCGLRGLGNFASQLMAVNKGSGQAWGVLTFSNGNYSTTATLNYGNTTGGARPAPEVGRVMRFIPTSGADVAISDVAGPVSGCNLSNFEPVTVKIKNLSGEVLSNITIRYKVDAGKYVAENYSGTLLPYAAASYTFTQRADFSAAGNHNLVVGAVMGNDINTTNDSKTVVVTKSVPVALPFKETFEGSFPAAGWNIVNPDAATTWEQSNVAGNGASTKAAYINFYDYETPSGQKDELISPVITLSGIPKLSFNYAYSSFSGSTDSLAIYLVTDCGSVLIKEPLFYDGGFTLATAETTQSKFVPADSKEWEKVTIDLSAYVGMDVQIKFVSINAYGNNLYLDDVEVKDYTEAMPVAAFAASKTTVNAGLDAVTFADNTSGLPTSWSWTFSGGSPATSTVQNPVVVYNEPGTYDVTLTAKNSAGENTITKSGFITVVVPNIISAIPPTVYGTSANSRGPNPSVKFQRTATLYTTSNSLGVNEINLNNGDVLKTFEFNIGTLPVGYIANAGNVKIYMQNSVNTAFSKSLTWSSTITGMTLVYDGPLTIPAATGFYGVTLASPFTYTGGNLYMAFEWTTATAGLSGLIYNCNIQGANLYTAASVTALPATLGATASPYRPQIRVSRDIKSNDAGVISVNTLASINPNTSHVVSAIVKNTGYHPINGLNVTLDVSGANTFNDVKAIDLAVGESKTVTFASYTTVASGTNTVKVSIPTDDVAINNEISIIQVIKDAVTGITLNPTTATLKVTGKTTLVATIAPAAAGNKNVVWSSADDAIATVDQSGVVTAIAVGTVKIKATAADHSNGTLFAECDITVEAFIPVTSVVLAKETTVITVGNNETLLYTVNPADAVNKNVVWSSSKESVATVDATGKVVAVSAGVANITVKTVDGNFEDVCVVTVPNVMVASISLSPATLSLYTSQTAVLTAAVLPANATDKTYEWSSSDNLIATVDAGGKVTGVAAGSAEIRATAHDGSAIFGARNVTVTAKVDLTGIALNQTTYNLYYDAAAPTTVQLTVTPSPADASNPASTWSSSFPTIAAVDATGKVTSVSIGTTIITATSVDNGTISSTCIINVVPIAVTGITLDNSTLNMNLGEPKTIWVTAIAPANATNRMVSWSTSDWNKATVDALGVVTAKAAGTVDIVATSVSNPGVTATCAVTIGNAAVGSVSIDKSYKELAVSQAIRLNASVFAVTPPALVDQAVTWTSSDNTKASVDAAGLVTGLVKDGTSVTITATSVADNTKSATCMVKVVQAVNSVVLSKHTNSMKSGLSFDLSATVNPGDADNKLVGWSSSDVNVATVNTYGHVLSIGAGTATITATSQSDQTKSDVCQVIVDNTRPVITLSGNNTVSLVYGSTYTDAGATASDNADGNLTASIVQTSTVNTALAGSYTVKYAVTDAAGNSAVEAVRTVNITKAPLTVAAENKTKVYGEANPALTLTYSGFVNGETSSVLTTSPAASTSIDASTPVGVYTGSIAAAGGADENYSFVYVAGNFTVTKATADISITSTTQIFDGVAKSVTTVTTPAGLTVGVTYAGAAALPVNAGTYAVVATINDANYQGSQSATLTISKAVAVVNITNLSQYYSGTAKSVTVATVPAGLAVTVTYDGSATAPSAVGTYAVVATVNDANYAGTQTASFAIAPNTGIEPNAVNADQIYADGTVIYVSITKIMKTAHLSVFNILGTPVYQTSNLAEGLNKIDGNIISGVYIVRLVVDGKTFSKRIMLNN